MNKKTIIYISFVLIFLSFTGYFAYKHFLTPQVKLKHLILNEFHDADYRKNLKMAIDNLTKEECEEIYEDYKDLSDIKIKYPSWSKRAVLQIVQDVFYKNVLKKSELLKDTVSINYKQKTINNISFLCPGEYTHYNENGGYLSSSTGFDYKIILATWNLPTLLKRIGVPDEIVNNRIDYYLRYIRELEVEFLIFEEIDEIYKKNYKVNALNIFEALMRNNYEIHNFYQDTSIKINLNNNLFKKQKIILGKHKEAEKYIICCYGALDSLGITLTLEHGKSTGKLEKSIEIAKTVWESFQYTTN